MADDGRCRDSVRIRMIENQNFHLASNGLCGKEKPRLRKKKVQTG